MTAAVWSAASTANIRLRAVLDTHPLLVSLSAAGVEQRRHSAGVFGVARRGGGGR